MYASARGEIDKVTILLAMGARVDAREQDFTPLLAAAQFGHTEVCQLLLANGSDLEEMWSFFFVSSTITMSGLRFVMHRSEGMVPPPQVLPNLADH